MMILLTHLYNLTPTWLNPGLLLSEKQATRSIIFFSFKFESSETQTVYGIILNPLTVRIKYQNDLAKLEEF